jgi:hypothetical protein
MKQKGKPEPQNDDQPSSSEEDFAQQWSLLHFPPVTEGLLFGE